ncbi:TonB-dependent receptor [Caulobacter sp. Root1455]|uniref:TonB-dependent receptor domain-containing protein n=1 Tax=unclassified Caulobacter TaxID=2648921 RepID=UPI0006F223EA|nr:MULTISPECIES: TonB-dependent receptor [unclassified Caulobacter]KQY27492.1 TonB-dependent receptor [Caulobacter sp. Root487D2Y]KQY92824.1 TonB-dependent receptor [Caulobacter sp. Root1455]
MTKSTHPHTCALLRNSSRLALTAALTAGFSIGLAATAAQAQTAQTAAAETVIDEVVVTGYRASLRSAMETKKTSDVMLDAINAEDIADFPDSNLAESLQRLPGISIDRDNGEGRTISVRGLSGDFSRVRINNMEALSTGANNDAGASPNRSRAFDFNAFASELFSSVRVRKSSSAEADEGSLGATVDLITGKPFDYKNGAFAASAEDSYYENGKTHSPRFTVLASDRWFDGKVGLLVSGAYAKRKSVDDNYARGGGSADYTYRGSTWTGNELPGRAGFAAPTGTVFSALIPTTLTGAALDAYKANAANYYDPLANPAAYAEMTGSDPAAYAKLYPNCAATAGQPVSALTPTTSGCNDSLIRFPALPTLNEKDVDTERLGLTAAFQVQISERTRLTVDALYSRFESTTTNYGLSPVGLNRNNTNASYSYGANVPTATARAGTAMTAAQRRALYPGACTFAAETELNPGQDCGQSLYGTTPLPGYSFSYSPYNLDPYEYYTNPTSPGYAGPAASLPFRGDLIGRPSVKLLDAEVVGQNAEYLKLGNVDWRSAADRGAYTTDFRQVSFDLTHEFSDRFRGQFSAGMSESTNENQGTLVEFNYMDAPEPFIFDERGANGMPRFDAGFNAADPNKWGIIKGFSGMRNYKRTTENTYKGLKADFTYELDDNWSVQFGGTGRKFEFTTNQFERNSDLLNPTEKEAGVSIASLGRVVNFGDGLEVPQGTTTSFFAPSLEAFDSVFDFDCNCINKYGDFRITRKRNRSASFGVTEDNYAYYAQFNFNYDVLDGRRLSGNVGVRQAHTEVNAQGETTAGRPIYGANSYDDTLPAGNVTFEAFHNFYIRAAAAKVMARPLLGNLSPAVTGISVPSDGSSTGGTLTVGNPKLSPFRGKAYDVAAEWYFTPGGLISLGYFRKDISSYPQTIFYEAPLSEFLDPEAIEALKLGFPGTTGGDVFRRAYIDANNPFLARQVRDAPGGVLQGWEFNYQQDLTFLPWYFKNLGVQFNATKLDTELTYILDPGNVNATTGAVLKAPVYGKAPWLGASPEGLNFTLYYETEKFNARVSVAHRAEYYTKYPVGAGNCDPGLQASGAACDSPLINEFDGAKATTNVDFSARYQPIEKVSITFEALNITNEMSSRFTFADPVVLSYGGSGPNYRIGIRYKY